MTLSFRMPPSASEMTARFVGWTDGLELPSVNRQATNLPSGDGIPSRTSFWLLINGSMVRAHHGPSRQSITYRRPSDAFFIFTRFQTRTGCHSARFFPKADIYF
jgi:hypothetical protein